MAIVKIGAPLSGIRGTIGGITYSANGAGPYCRQWSRGSDPGSPKQATQRAYLARMPQAWAALTAAQRTAWDTFAALAAQALTNSLGETYYASGFNWFCKCNTRLLRSGRSLITATPTQARPAAPTISDFRVTVAGSDPDVATGGTASASTFAPGQPASNAFDDSAATYWVTASGNTTGWLQYVLSSSKIIRGYSITSFSTRTTAPVDWTFERLDAGPTWTPIDTITGHSWPADGPYYFFCPNETSSTTYRINVTQNNGSASFMGLAEMEYFVCDEERSVIIYPEDEFSASPDYDLVLHVAQGSTPARIAQYPGYLETLVTQSPGRTYELLQDVLETQLGIISEDRSFFARLYRQTQEGIRSAAATAIATT